MPVTRRTLQILSGVLLLLGLFWIYYSRTDAASNTSQFSSAPQKGFLSPDFEAQTMTGETVRLANFRGSPVILNLWASWCLPCREEMPALQQIYVDYEAQGLVVLGVHMTAQDTKEAAANFIAENSLTFPVPLDTSGAISRLYRVQALPTTYFIDANGLITAVIIGGPVSEAVFRSQAEALLQGAP